MSTVADPIRFRCFQCNKLLGVSRSKAGLVVACPQCSAELVVPEPVETASPPPSPTPKPTETTKSSSSSRIEPVVVLWDASPSADDSAHAAQAFPAVQLEPVSLRAEPAARPRPAARPAKASSRDDAEAVDVAAAMAMAVPRAVIASPPAEQVVLPVLAVESPSLREEPAARGGPARSSGRERSVRRDDVVMPRTALILWSILVLLALVFAFAAGLLAGRFLWARGVVVAVNKPVAAHRQSTSGRENPIASPRGREV